MIPEPTKVAEDHELLHMTMKGKDDESNSTSNGISHHATWIGNFTSSIFVEL